MSLFSIAALQVELLHGDNHDRLEEQTARGFHQRFHDYCMRDVRLVPSYTAHPLQRENNVEHSHVARVCVLFPADLAKVKIAKDVEPVILSQSRRGDRLGRPSEPRRSNVPVTTDPKEWV